MPPAPALVSKTLALGAGSFWGTEKFVVDKFLQHFPGSIENAQVGYMHPPTAGRKLKHRPTHADVCTGTTGFVEVLFISLTNPTPDIVEELFKFFFMFHDPTTKNRQGKDLGTQYASTIFCSDEYQKAIARQVRRELQNALTESNQGNNNNNKNKSLFQYQNNQIQTKIVDQSQFYPADEEHQQYLQKNPTGYCNHYIRFQEWPKMDRFCLREDIQRSIRKPPSHRRWNRKSIFYSLRLILEQIPPEDFALILQEVNKKKPTHRRWNRKSIFSSFTKILKEMDMQKVTVH